MGRKRTYNWAVNAANLDSMVHLHTTGPSTFLALPGWIKGGRPYGFFDSGVNVAYYVSRTWDDANSILRGASGYRNSVRAIAGVGNELKVPAHAFSVVGVCPPYLKPDPREAKSKFSRSPYEWDLLEAAHYLVPGGIALVCVPADTLEVGQGSFVRYLLRRFEVLHFGYLPRIQNAHSQGVGIVARARKNWHNVRDQDVLGFLALLKKDLPEFHDVDVNKVPFFPSAEVKPFESTRVDPEEALRLASASSLYASVAHQAGKPLYDATPPMPLKTGHVALNLATGRLNGVIGDGRFRHVVNGRVVRATESHRAETEEGEVLTVHDVLGVEITALGADGQVFAFQSGATTTADEEDGE